MQHVQASRAYWQPMPSRLDFYSKHELQPTALSWCTTTRPWQLTTLPWCQQLGDSAYARRNNEQLLGCYANYSAAHSTTWLHIRLLGRTDRLPGCGERQPGCGNRLLDCDDRQRGHEPS